MFFAQRERERVTANLEHDANVIATLYEDDLENDQPLDPAAADRVQRPHRRPGGRRRPAAASRWSTPPAPSIATSPPGPRSPRRCSGGGRREPDPRTRWQRTSSTSRCRSRPAAPCTARCASRSTPATSRPASTASGSDSPPSPSSSSASSPSSGGGWPAPSHGPVRQLQADADRFADGDLTVAPGPPSGPPELRALADSIATMATRLDELLGRPAHLRRRRLTPAALTADRAEAAPREPPQPPPHGRAEPSSTAAIEETDRLGALVNDLLQLARADDRPPRARRRPRPPQRRPHRHLDRGRRVPPRRAANRRTRHASHRRRRARRHRADPRQPPRQRPQRRRPPARRSP